MSNVNPGDRCLVLPNGKPGDLAAGGLEVTAVHLVPEESFNYGGYACSGLRDHSGVDRAWGPIWLCDLPFHAPAKQGVMTVSVPFAYFPQYRLIPRRDPGEPMTETQGRTVTA